MIRVRFDRVSKRYLLGRRLPTLREALAGRLAGDGDGRAHHWALRAVSFELGDGATLAILGPNGSGKTTILRILSGVTQPTEGTVHVDGKLSALLDLGAGFHPELTGRENIYLNGALLGLRRSEVRERFEQICAFAGIGEYLDTPVKRYSSGMYVRLGFAVAAHIEPRVLLVDEVLAVGDYAFRQRCYARMEELRRAGASLILVSHDMEAVRRICDRGMILYRGEKVYEGSVGEAILSYSETMREAARRARPAVPVSGGLAERVMTFDAEIVGVRLLDEGDRETSDVPCGSAAAVIVDVVFHRHVHEPVFAIVVRDADGRRLYATTTQWLNVPTTSFTAGSRCRARFDLRVHLVPGLYEIGADVSASDASCYHDRVESALRFHVSGTAAAQGVVDLAARVSFSVPPRDDPAPESAVRQFPVRASDTTTWADFAREIRSSGRPLLARLDDFPGAILVTGVQRSGTTALARILGESDGMVDLGGGRDPELDGALLLCGAIDGGPPGRYCFQTTYVNERHREYLEHAAYKMIWVLRRPASVVYSMLYHWRDEALRELFEACGRHLLGGVEARLAAFFGPRRVSRLRQACLAYNGKLAQLFELGVPLGPERLLVVDYDELADDPERVLAGIYAFVGLAYRRAYATKVRSGSVGKELALTQRERDAIERCCGDLYRRAGRLVRPRSSSPSAVATETP